MFLNLKLVYDMRVIPSNVYLIEILITIAFMPIDNYTQWATKGPGNKFYINRKGRGGLSISEKNVKILAQQIIYLND